MLEASTSLNGANSTLPNKLLKANYLPPKAKMDQLIGIDIHFIHKKRGHSPETQRLWMERKQVLNSEKTRNIGKGKHNERHQEYRPSQLGRKRIVELNVQIYNRLLYYCETLGTTPLREYQQNNYESWLSDNLSGNESQVSYVKQQKCPVNALKKFRRHETLNLISLKQTVKANTMETDHKERTTEIIKKAEKEFALDLPLLVDETARDVKILITITGIETDQLESIFYPYRTHRSHLTTRFGLLFYNDKIGIPEPMRTTIIAMLHQGHP